MRFITRTLTAQHSRAVWASVRWGIVPLVRCKAISHSLGSWVINRLVRMSSQMASLLHTENVGITEQNGGRVMVMLREGRRSWVIGSVVIVCDDPATTSVRFYTSPLTPQPPLPHPSSPSPPAPLPCYTHRCYPPSPTRHPPFLRPPSLHPDPQYTLLISLQHKPWWCNTTTPESSSCNIRSTG